MEAKKMQVWWIPQVPMKPFIVPVSSEEEASLLLDALAAYDLFQYQNNVKPDYCNAGGLQVWSGNVDGEGTPGWEDWYDEETGEDFDDWRATRLTARFTAIADLSGLHQ